MVPLDAGEVRQQLQHFLQRSPLRGKSTSEAGAACASMQKLTISFPTTISCYDLGVFIMLRTLYRIDNSSELASNINIQSISIPLDFNNNMRAIWGDDTCQIQG